MAPLLQHRDEVLLERVARVVGADRDPHPASVLTGPVPPGRCSATMSQPAGTVRCVDGRAKRRGSRRRCCGGPTTMCRRRLAQRARGRQAAREPAGRRALRGLEPARSPTPGSRTPTPDRPRPRRSSSPPSSSPSSARLYRAAAQGYLADVRRPARPARRPRLADRARPSSASTSSAILGLALELPDGAPRAARPEARRPAHRRAAARPGRAARRARPHRGVGARRSSRSSPPTSSSRRSIAYTPDLAAERAEAHAWIAERVAARAGSSRPTAAPRPGADCHGCAFIAGCAQLTRDRR